MHRGGARLIRNVRRLMPRILLASAALLFALEAAACQCDGRPSLQESLGATAIFEGTIVDMS